MIIRREDFGSVKSLSRGSQKNIWFICDECGIGILQSFRNYLNQKERKLCRSCRNKNTAKKMSVKKKQSDAAKNMWKEKGFKDNKKRYHRFNFRKSELSKKLDIFDADKTEVQNMVINGWNRIFDCGNILYEKIPCQY